MKSNDTSASGKRIDFRNKSNLRKMNEKLVHKSKNMKVANIIIGEGTLIDPSAVLGHPAKDALSQCGSLSMTGHLEIGFGCVIRSGSVLYEHVIIGNLVQIAHHVVVREGSVVGDGCALGNHCVLREGAKLGRNVRLQEGVTISENAEIGNDVFMGMNVSLTAGRYMTGALQASGKMADEEAYRLEGKNWNGPSVIIGDEARIGSNAVLLAGVKIGSGAIVAAGAVVSMDVPSQTMVAGNPARIIKRIASEG